MEDPTDEFLNFPARTAIFYALGWAAVSVGADDLNTPALFWPFVGFELSGVVGIACLALASYVFLKAAVKDDRVGVLFAVLGVTFLGVGLFTRFGGWGELIAAVGVAAIAVMFFAAKFLRRAPG